MAIGWAAPLIKDSRGSAAAANMCHTIQILPARPGPAGRTAGGLLGRPRSGRGGRQTGAAVRRAGAGPAVRASLDPARDLNGIRGVRNRGGATNNEETAVPVQF